MGKRIISQRRGRGSMRYRSPKHKYQAPVTYPSVKEEGCVGIVRDIIHHPGRSAPNALVDFDGDIHYIMAPEGLKVNAEIKCGTPTKDPAPGDILELGQMLEGTIIYGIEKAPGSGPVFCRTGGSAARVVGKIKDRVLIQFPSKKTKELNPLCRASVGVIAGGGRLEKPIVKAGVHHFAKKAKNKLWPIVSGTSMNAVDHPFGGSSSAHHGKHTEARVNAPPGAKVGKIRPKRTGKKR